MSDRDAVRQFFRTYEAAAVGPTPPQPNIPVDPEDNAENPTVDLEVETKPPDDWQPKIVGETPAKDGEFPIRFIDGSQTGHPVVCVRAPLGWPIPMFLAEVGAVALRSDGRRFTREFAAVERVLAFVADPFPWEEVESFAAALASVPEFVIHVVPANLPNLAEHSPFDYEVMRSQARSRTVQEIRNLERIALASGKEPTLVDGPLNRVTGVPPTFFATVGRSREIASGVVPPRCRLANGAQPSAGSTKPGLQSCWP